MKNLFILVAFDPKKEDTPIFFGYGLFVIAMHKDNTYEIIGSREDVNLGYKHLCNMPTKFIDWNKVENACDKFITGMMFNKDENIIQSLIHIN